MGGREGPHSTQLTHGGGEGGELVVGEVQLLEVDHVTQIVREMLK